MNYGVDIIIPVYNAETTLERCLNSVKNQTYTNWNVILIDDCSSDGSRAIIEKYASDDSRFRYILNDKNLGVSAARNKALDELTAQYAAFLDSDDWWESEMLEKLINGAADTGADIVQCRYMYNYSGGKTYVPGGAFRARTFLDNRNFKPLYIKMMTGINMNHVCMKLIKTSLIKDVRFDTNMKTAEDLDFVIKAIKNAQSYLFIPDIMYHYYRVYSSLTGSGLTKREKIDANRKISKTILKSLDDWGMNKPLYKMMANSRVYIIIISKIFRSIREKILTSHRCM